MDIKLILENQLVIMRWLAESDNVSDITALIVQIQKTQERIEQWGVSVAPLSPI